MPDPGRSAPEVPGRRAPGRLRPRGEAPLGELGIAGFSRARLAWLAGFLVLAWVAAGFVGQAGDASRAASRAASVREANAALEQQVSALRDEVALVEQPRWVAQQARAYGLGTAKEQPFVLAPNAPPLAANAPGSAARRLGTEQVQRSPLETWLDILFGSQE